MIVVGVDPDSEKHGMAFYVAGKLVELGMMSLIEIREWLDTAEGDVMFSIENVKAQNFTYGRHIKQGGAKVVQKIALSVGRNQQAQTELVRELDHRGIPYQLIKPTKDNWADNKRIFERLTGWKGSSNKDNRSAAYFGYVAVMKQPRGKRGN